MSKHDEARRAFLKGAAIGAGAVAGAGLVPEAFGQTHEQHTDNLDTTAQAHAHGPGHGAFLNDDDAVTVAAFAERLMPGASGKPGAGDAGVLNYIDLALAGAYADLQNFYRRGLWC
jgi:gluconate 2-dehydrogenase gamma chain